jgi:CheY-like chemotaxis protein/DNA-directed RNA polymerase specialized sigma24 family protein
MSDVKREDLMRALPYARRYARALTGSRSGGDHQEAESLRELLADEQASNDMRLAFYEQITRRFNRMERLQTALRDLSVAQRELLLLTSLEELPVEEAALVVAMTQAEAALCLAGARERLRESAAADVLIIEDEPIIAMDLEELVQGCGHRVVGVAASESEAVAIAARTRPGLILADINLGIGGDGTAAVARILQGHQVPVIFVTAYPERLLTGDAIEPAFVITKPFEPMTLAIATYQAVTGGLRIA